MEAGTKSPEKDRQDDKQTDPTLVPIWQAARTLASLLALLSAKLLTCSCVLKVISTQDT